MENIRLKFVLKNKLKGGEYPIYLRFTKNRKSSFLKMNLSCTNKIKGWNNNNGYLKKSEPHYIAKNKSLKRLYLKAESIVFDYTSQNRFIDFQILKSELFCSNDEKITIFNFFDIVINDFVKIKTKKWYQDTRASFKKFLKNRDIFFDALTTSLLEEYKQYLTKNNNRNSINSRLRCLRAQYNRAIKKEVFKSNKTPFVKGLIPTYQIPSKSSSLSKSDMRKLIQESNNPCILNENELFYLNTFVFSYFSYGMGLTDIIKLSYDKVSADKITYYRSKTAEHQL